MSCGKLSCEDATMTVGKSSIKIMIGFIKKLGKAPCLLESDDRLESVDDTNARELQDLVE